MADLYSTNNLTAVVNSLIGTPSFFLDNFFGTVQTEESEEIHFDVEVGDRKLAPFVSPKVAGKIVAENGYETKTFKPAYLKPKTPLAPGGALKRAAGEQIGGVLSPMQRQSRRVLNVLESHDKQIRRRLEVMGAEALRTGKVTVTGDDYGTVVVDFGRNTRLTVVLGTGSKWGETDVKAMDAIEANHANILELSGVDARDVVMDTEAFKKFKADAYVEKQLDQKHVVNAQMAPRPVGAEGAAFMGTIDGFNIWTYAGWYTDDEGDTQPILPANSLIQTGQGIDGVQAYGAIQDEAAGLQALPRFSKSWVPEDPAIRQVLTQSAPMVVPTRVNGCAFTKVA